MAKTNEQKYAEANGCIELDAPGATRRIAVSFELFVAYNEDINRVRNANARDQDHGTVSADALLLAAPPLHRQITGTLSEMTCSASLSCAPTLSEKY